jgi:predicted nucleotidyltransferase
VSDQPQDQLSVLKLVTGRLDAAQIPYMINGSIASGHYGHPRMTRDIDMVVHLEPADAPRLTAALGDEFAADPDAVRAALSRSGMLNVIHREAVVKVDLVVRKDTAYRIEEFERRRRIDVDGHGLWMVSPEDLILSKLVWAKDSRSELQLRDVRSVLRLQKATLDRAYMERWATSLSVRSLLRELDS